MSVQGAYIDAQSTNESKRSAKIYKDLNLNFTRHPTRNDLTPLTDAAAIKRSVRNLVQYNHYEKPFHPEIGSNIRQSLFEPLSTLTAGVLTHNIQSVLETHEPRIIIHRIDSTPDINRNAYNVRLDFFIINATTELISFEFILERIR